MTYPVVANNGKLNDVKLPFEDTLLLAVYTYWINRWAIRQTKLQKSSTKLTIIVRSCNLQAAVFNQWRVDSYDVSNWTAATFCLAPFTVQFNRHSHNHKEQLQIATSCTITSRWRTVRVRCPATALESSAMSTQDSCPQRYLQLDTQPRSTSEYIVPPW